MNQNKQRIAIAEYLGLKVAQSIGDNADCWFTKEMERDRRQRWPNACVVRTIPDYLNDLNAMHEAEETLQSHHLCYEYNNKLYNILGNTVGNRADKPHHWTWHATAAQRAEAFLKTIGKWEENG